MAVVFSNNAVTTLAAGIDAAVTSVTVQDGSVFPALVGSNYTYVTFENLLGETEIVKVTAISGNTLTVVRAQDNTTARAFSSASKCELRLTAALLNEVAAQADTDTVYTHPANHAISVITGLQAALDGKLPLAGGTLTGTLAMGANAITSTGTISSGAITSSGKLDVKQIGADTVVDIRGNSSYDPVLNLRSDQGAITTEGFQIWYDNSVGDVHLHTTHPVTGASAIRFHTATGTDKATNNERFTINGNGNINIVSGTLSMGGTPVIDASRNLTSIGTISSGAITSTGLTVNGDLVLGDDLNKIKFTGVANAMYLRMNGSDQMSFYANDNTTEVVSFGNGGGLRVKTGTLQMGTTTVIGASRAFYFETELHGSSKKIFSTGDSYLRMNEGNEFSSGIWLGASTLMTSGGYIAAGSNGGTTTSRVYIKSGTYSGTNVIAIDGTDGKIQGSYYSVGTTTVIDSSRQIFAKTGTQVGEDGAYAGYGVIGFGGITNGYNRVFGNDGTDDGLFLAAATGRGIYIRPNGVSTDLFGFSPSGQLTVAGVVVLDQSRNLTNIGTLNGGTPWTSSNDGSGSGLDADLLDGIDSTRVIYGGNATGTNNANPTVTSSPYQKSGFYDVNGTASNAPTNTYYSYINMRHTNTANNHGHQIAGSFYSQGDLYNRQIDNNSYGSWSKIWNTTNDGSGSGLDADLLDGQQGSSFATLSGANSFSNSYNEFGNSTGSVSNDGSWNARVNIAGSSHARLDVKSVSDGIITTMYSHAGQAAGKVGTYSNHPLHLMVNGTEKAVLSTTGSLSTTSQGTLWGASNDGSGSGLDADLLDGIDSGSFLRSDVDDIFTGNLTTGADNHITFGPNSSWGSSLRIGGNGRTATGTEMASIATTDGNIHMDAANSTNGIYLNFYAGTNGTIFGNGASGQVAKIDSSGNFTLNGTINGGTPLQSANYNSYSPTLTGGNASGTWGINITGSAPELLSKYPYAASGWIFDYTTAQALSPGVGSTTVSMHNGHGLMGGWATTLTMSGYERYGAYQISGKYDSSPPELAMRNYSQALSGWTTWTSILSSANYNSYSPTLTGGGASGTWNISVSGNAATATTAGNSNALGGLAVHPGTNNEANKVVRTDGNGYLNTGWINTASGDSGIANRLTRIYSSYDNYLRYSSLTDFKVHMGLSAKNSYSRHIDYTSNANYHVGSMGQNGIGANEVFHGGSGFFDIWSSTNLPPGTSHVHGFNALHYTTNAYGTSGGDAYGIQVAGQYSQGGLLFSRGCASGSFSGWRRQIDDNNYNSYSPTLTGGNASGTWGINVTGSSATANYVTGLTLTSSANGINPDSVTQNQLGYNTSVSLFGQTDGGLYSTAYSGQWVHQIYGDFRSGQIAVRGKNSGNWQPWRSVLDSSNYNSYSPTLTGGNASGTWGISISGTAAAASLLNAAGGAGIQSISGASTSYSYAVCVREPNGSSGNTGVGHNPRLGFHWGGIVASSIEITTAGAFRFMNNPGTGFEDVYASTFHGAFSGNATTATTAARATRSNGSFYMDNNYGNSIIGVYSHLRYQGVYSMGSAYVLPADGTTTGNLYGMAWSYPSAGGAAGNLDSHGMLVLINGGYGSSMSYSIKASGNVTAYSDERLKTNWKPMPENFVSRLSEVRVGIYDRTDGEQLTQVGVSAQSLQVLLPEAIITATDEIGTLSVNYGGAALASAVELAKVIVEQEKRIERLERLIEKLTGETL